jgi:hypothetical protein
VLVYPPVPEPYALLTPAELATFGIGPSPAPIDSDNDADDDDEEEEEEANDDEKTEDGK